MNNVFVWNTAAAEQVRASSERALQNQSNDMRQTAARLLEAANQQEAQAAQLQAKLPIMKTITRTISGRYLGNGEYELETITEQVVDAAATASVRAQIAQLRAAVAELRSAARVLDAEKYELDRATRRANELFYEMFNLCQQTDARYAQRLSEIREEIMAYLYRIQELRDSIGVQSSVGNASIGAVLMNYTSFRMPWSTVREILARPHNNISQLDYNNLAWFFTLQDTNQGMQRFLNYLADPIDVISFNAGGVNNVLFSGDVAFSICPHKVANLQHHLEIGIAVSSYVLMTLPQGNSYNVIERRLYAKMVRTTMLSVIASNLRTWENTATGQQLSHVFVGREVNGYAGGPFSISGGGSRYDGWNLSFQRAHGVDISPSLPPGTSSQFIVQTPQQRRSIYISQALDGIGLAAAHSDLLVGNLNMMHNFDRTAAIWEATRRVAVAAALSEAFDALGLPQAILYGSEIWHTVREQEAQALEARIRNYEIANELHLGQYFRDLFIMGVAVVENGEIQLRTWPSPYTYAAFNSFNNTMANFVSGDGGPESFQRVTWQAFMRNPMEYYAYHRDLNPARTSTVYANAQDARNAQWVRNAPVAAQAETQTSEENTTQGNPPQEPIDPSAETYH